MNSHTNRDKLMLDEKNARAQRVIQLRQLTELSQGGLAKLSGFPVQYIKQWEEHQAEGLSEKLGINFIRSISKLGVDCSLGWLMEGRGDPPKIMAYQS